MGWQEDDEYEEEGVVADRNLDSKQRNGAPSDQSFRESFYSSGTEWKSLYEVDEYGMPVDNVDDKSAVILLEDFQGQTFCTRDLTTKKQYNRSYSVAVQSSSDSQTVCITENAEDVDRMLTAGCSGKRQFDSVGGKSASKVASGKLVQTDLFGFLGIKPKPEPSSEQGSCGKRLKQLDIGVLFGIPPAVKNPAAGAAFMSKLQRPGLSTENINQRRKGRGRDQSQGPDVVRKCPFYKKMPGTSFTVDAFRYGEVEGCSAYFLTHFHYDHYGGLTKAWSHGPIYCTPVTARLCVLCLYVDPRWICPLQIGVTHIIEDVEVRMLEANHCPGAALILFRFKNGTSILHTGDFRACRNMETYPELLSGKIDTVYLDTTYCNQRYRFPLQEEVIKFVIRQTCNALVRNKKTLVVVGSYSIGKERVYHSIAEALGVQVYADQNRRRILTSLEWPELASKLSLNPGDTFLHVLPLSTLNPPKLKAYLQSHAPKYSAILAFRPTGWTYTEKVGDKLEMIKPQCSGPVTIFGVPYSEHSSFTELQQFIQFVRPRRIVPTVNVGKASDREKMQAYFDQWLAH